MALTNAAAVVCLRVVLLISIAKMLSLVSAQSVVVLKFVSGSANITVTNDTFTGRTTVVALTSPGDSFELVLIQDGFGTDTKFQYCWTEVHDTATGSNLTWRAPCNPLRVDFCTLILTSDGDFRLNIGVKGVQDTAFLTSTGGDGVVDVQVTNDGDLVLVKADNSSVWKSEDNLQSQKKCREAFSPSSSHRLESRPVALAVSVAISVALSIFSCFYSS